MLDSQYNKFLEKNAQERTIEIKNLSSSPLHHPSFLEHKDQTEQSLSALYFEKIPHKLSDFGKMLARKASGAVPGGEYAIGDTRYLIKNFGHYNGVSKDQAENDYVFGPIFQRILYDRAPSYNLVIEDDSHELRTSSKYLNISPGAHNVSGHAKVVAASVFMNDQDFDKSDNTLHIWNGVDTVLAKIDHGLAGSAFRNFENLMNLLHRGEKNFAGKVELRELIDTFKQISFITNQEIYDLVYPRLYMVNKANNNQKASSDIHKHTDLDTQFICDILAKNLQFCNQYIQNIEKLQRDLGGVSLQEIQETLGVGYAGSENPSASLLYKIVKEGGITRQMLVSADQFNIEQMVKYISNGQIAITDLPGMSKNALQSDRFTTVSEIAISHNVKIKDMPDKAWDQHVKQKDIEDLARYSQEQKVLLNTIHKKAWSIGIDKFLAISDSAAKLDISQSKIPNQAWHHSNEKLVEMYEISKKYGIELYQLSDSAWNHTAQEVDDFLEYAKNSNIKIQHIDWNPENAKDWSESINEWCDEHEVKVEDFPGGMEFSDSTNMISLMRRLRDEFQIPTKEISIDMCKALKAPKQGTEFIKNALEKCNQIGISLSNICSKKIWKIDLDKFGTVIEQFKDMIGENPETVLNDAIYEDITTVLLGEE